MDEEMDFSTFYKHMLSPLVVKVILETLFYGILLVLFSVCMAIHHRQHYAARRTLTKTGLICLFILATATTSLDTTSAMRQMWLYLGKDWGGQTSLDEESISRLTVQLDVICGTLVFGLYIVSNFTADLMLMNSVFWSGSNRQWMIWLPLSISVFSNALGIVGIALEASDISLYPSLSVPFDQYTNGDKIILAYLFINVCLNLVITGCLAGRVWWISRKTVLSVGEHPLKRTYNAVVAITLESGILYPIALVGSVGATLQNSTAPNLYPFLIQVAAIAPTLIVVRTVLGISIEQDTDSYEEISAETTTFTRNEGADYMRTKTPPPPFDPYPNGNFAPTSFSATVVSKGKAGRTLTYNPCTN